MANLSGQELGKYRVIERIGRGGMAEVYMGVHKYLDRKVAIKVLHGHLFDDPSFITRFKREAKAVANLKHPNIVQVHDFDIEENFIYMVMEFIQGTNLHMRLVELEKKGERLPITTTAKIISEIASALDYAHSKGMLHRDIKPSNILLDKHDKSYLTDFGIAKLANDPKITATGAIIGTPAYMSPEQGKGEDLTKESDIYSLGVVAFELLTGQVPYDAKTPIAIVQKLINDPIPDITQVANDVPGTTKEVIETVLAKSPTQRYSSADALVRAIRVALDALEDQETKVQDSVASPETIPNEEAMKPTVAMGEPDYDKTSVAMGDEKDIAATEVMQDKPPDEVGPTLIPAKGVKIPLWGWVVGALAVVAVIAVVLLQTLGGPAAAPEPDTVAEAPAGVEEVEEAVQDENEIPAEGSEVGYSGPTTLFTAPGFTEGLEVFEDAGGDADIELAEADGVPVWRTGNGSVVRVAYGDDIKDYYMLVNIADEIMYGGDPTSEVLIEIEYFDEGTDWFRIEYDALTGGQYGDGRFMETDWITKTNSGDFKTAVFTLEDANFRNRTHGADFRINDNDDGAESIRNITVVLLGLESEAAAIFEEGISFFERGEFDAAQAAFDQAMLNGYETVELLVHLGATRRELGDYLGAIEVLREAVEREPENFGAWYTLAESYYNTGEDQYKDEAHWAMDHALELDPNNPDAHWLMGMIRYYRFGNPDEALMDLTRAIELRPDDTFFYNMRGVIYLETGQWEPCVADYNVFAEHDPKNPYAYFERAQCYLGLDETDLAREDYERFLDVSQGDPNFNHMRAVAQEWLENN